MSRIRALGRLVLLALLAALVAAGCASPGQLGQPAPASAAAPPPDPAAAAPVTADPAPAGPAQIGTGTLAERIELRTLGPAQVTVRTVVLEPGETTGWHRHPGTETTIVDGGSVVVRQAGQCTPRGYGAGDAVFVPDAQPHEMRNDGPEPARLVVTWILAPDTPERDRADDPCAGRR